MCCPPILKWQIQSKPILYVSDEQDVNYKVPTATYGETELEITVQSQQQLMEKLVNQQSEMQDLLKCLKAQLQANKQDDEGTSEHTD
nr:uncharacterized protein LOC113705487 isoform X2 [Coffea arabica]